MDSQFTCLSISNMQHACGRAFHHYREARDQKDPIKKHPVLDRLLKEEFRSLGDFNRIKGRSTMIQESG